MPNYFINIRYRDSWEYFDAVHARKPNQDITTFINAHQDLFCTLSNLGSFLLATRITCALMGQAFIPLLACIAVGFACMFMGMIIASVLWGVYLGIVDASINQAHLENQARPGF